MLDIFSFIYPKYKIKKPIKLYEFFAGYGSQALSLKHLGVSFTHGNICEWAVNSIQAYKDLHYHDTPDIPCTLTKEELVNYLYNKGVSVNYNEPATISWLQRASYDKLATTSQLR